MGYSPLRQVMMTMTTLIHAAELTSGSQYFINPAAATMSAAPNLHTISPRR